MVRLNSGASMPLVGLGTAHLYREKGRAALRAALAAGYRHIDCAKVYGNESIVGEELAAAIHGIAAGAGASAGAGEPGASSSVASVPPIAREDLFIVSKLWNDEHAPEDVATACRRSLAHLQLDYLDLYLAGRCRSLTATKPVLNAPMVSALEPVIS